MNKNNTETKKNRSLFDYAEFSGMGTSRRLVKSVISKSFGALADKFVHTSTRVYGIMGLSFGLLSLFIYLGKYYILTEPDLPLSTLVISLIFAVVSVPLLLFDKPLCMALQDFPPTSYILFDFFSIKRIAKDESKPGLSAFTALFIGFIPGLFTVFTDIRFVLIGIGLLMFIGISFVTPEFTIVFTVLIAPYLSPIPDKGFALAFLAILSVISFITKLIVGKRIFHLEIYDLIFILLAIALIVSGIITGKTLSSLIALFLAFGYSLTSNLIANRRIADCVVNALVASSVPISILALVKYILALVSGERFTGNVLFTTRDSYLAFLLIVAIFAFNYAKGSRSKLKRFLYSVASMLALINIILSWQLELWLALALATPAYLIIKNPKIRKEWLLLLIAVPYLIFAIPERSLDRISDMLMLPTSICDIKASIVASFDIIADAIFFGHGIDGMPHIYNTFLAMLASTGMFTLILIVALYVINLTHISRYEIYMKNSDMSNVVKTGTLAIFATFTLSAMSDVFSDITLYYLFTAVLGVVNASLRLSKNEYDERIGYYGTTRSEDSSDVSVRISI